MLYYKGSAVCFTTNLIILMWNSLSSSFMPWISWVSFYVSHSSPWVSVLPNSSADSQAEVGVIAERTAHTVGLLPPFLSISSTASIHPVRAQFLWPLVIRQALVSTVEIVLLWISF